MRRAKKPALRGLAVALAAPTVLAVGLVGMAPAQARVAPRSPVSHGETQPVFSYADAVREHVQVQTGVDSDGDGRPDRVGVDIIRPRETEHGLKVPVIMDESPYYDNLGRGNESERKAYDAAGLPATFPLFYDNYFVPRGYAVVLADMVGTNHSDGCPTTGGRGDVLGGKAVVDWLNGRAKAFRADGSEARATWSTGKVAMIGKSYDGTLANAVAATGVEGLTTIVPISAISSWYDYYRMNGVIYFRHGPPGLSDTVDTDPDAKCAAVRDALATGSDDATGDYNAFWDERNYREGTVGDVRNVRASVFVVHGLNDLNVKPNHFSQWWTGLARNHVPRKIWLSQYGHVDPFDFRRDVWIETLHRWFDFWLYGIDNGIMREPRLDLEVGPDQWVTRSDWPDPAARDVSLWFGAGQPGGAGSLSPTPTPGHPTQAFTDDPGQTESQMVADPETAKPGRLVYLSPALKRALRVSGTPEVDIRASLDQPDANLTALLVDYGDDVRVDHLGRGEGITTLDQEACYGESTPADDACYKLTETVTKASDVEIVARGWLDAHNRRSLSREQRLVPGKAYRFRWTTLPQDYVFKPGHHLAVVIAGSDRSETRPDQPAQATVTLKPAVSRVDLPVVGGARAVLASFGGARAGHSG